MWFLRWKGTWSWRFPSSWNVKRDKWCTTSQHKEKDVIGSGVEIRESHLHIYKHMQERQATKVIASRPGSCLLLRNAIPSESLLVAFVSALFTFRFSFVCLFYLFSTVPRLPRCKTRRRYLKTNRRRRTALQMFLSLSLLWFIVGDGTEKIITTYGI